MPMGPDAEGRRCPQRRGRGARPVRLGSRPGPVWSARRASPAVMRRPRELWAQGRMGPPRRGGDRGAGGGSLRWGAPPAPCHGPEAPPSGGCTRRLLPAEPAPPPPAPRVSWSAALQGLGRPRPVTSFPGHAHSGRSRGVLSVVPEPPPQASEAVGSGEEKKDFSERSPGVLGAEERSWQTFAA